MSGAGWTDDATKALLSTRGEHNIQDQLDGVKRNKHIYYKIASELAENGFQFTAKQCRTKVKNLAQSYRKVNDDPFAYVQNVTYKLKKRSILLFVVIYRPGITTVYQARISNTVLFMRS